MATFSSNRSHWIFLAYSLLMLASDWASSTQEKGAAALRSHVAPSLHSPLWNAPAEPSAGPGSVRLSGLERLTDESSGLFYGFRVAREDWSGLIERMRSDSTVARWIAQERARVDYWIRQQFERPDLIGGWVHDYIDPQTRMAKPWQPSDPEPMQSSTDAERKYKAAWVARGRDYNVAQMQSAARIFRATGESRYAEWAADQLDFYARQYTRWPLRTTEGRSTMYQQGLDEAVAAFALIDTARLLEDYVGHGRATAWRDGLFMPMAANLKSTSAPKSNIQLWHAAAIAAISMRYRDKDMLDYAINDPAGIKANLTAGLTADHLWIEGTFSYNTYVIECLAKLLIAASIEGLSDRFGAEAASALRMLFAPLEYRFDDGTLPNPGDSTSSPTAVSELAHWYLFRVVPTYWGIAKAQDWRTWESLLDPPIRSLPRTPPTLPTAQTRNFESLRWSVLRAGSWQAFVRYGGMKANHWTEEAFNFELREGVTVISADPGTVSYGSPVHGGYFQRGPAANAPLVDGENQPRVAPGTLINFDAATSSLTAEQSAFQPDAKVRASFRVTRAGFVEQSSITIPSGKARRLGKSFNTTCEILPSDGATPTAAIPGLPPVSAFTYWTNVTTYTTSVNWQLILKCPNNKNYLMQIWGPSSQRLYVGKAPNTRGLEPRNSIYYEVSAPSAVFESSITAH